MVEEDAAEIIEDNKQHLDLSDDEEIGGGLPV
jgi:hypothetical protein